MNFFTTSRTFAVVSMITCFFCAANARQATPTATKTSSGSTLKSTASSKKPDSSAQLSPTAAAPSTALNTFVSLPPVVSIAVEQWPGKSFLILRKTEMFRKFGHYLYTTPTLEKDPTRINPDIELKNHRLLYQPFAGHTVNITKVTRLKDGEFLVSGILDTLGLAVYGKTAKGVIEGLLLQDDLTQARSRWSGTTIYSRRRLVDIYDSTNSKFTNVKVSILEPLKVIDVRAGIIPLPPKPLWLMVERPDKSTGFIPLLYSFTNVLKEKQNPGQPWDMDIFELDPRKAYPDCEQYTWATIDSYQVHEGMSRQQVLLSWGYPRDSVAVNSGQTEWNYGNSRLTFTADTLSSIVNK